MLGIIKRERRRLDLDMMCELEQEVKNLRIDEKKISNTSNTNLNNHNNNSSNLRKQSNHL